MDLYWKVLIFLHLTAMAYFFGGQIMMAANVVPIMLKQGDRESIRQVARQFGYGTLVAFAVLVVTGVLMLFDMSDAARSFMTGSTVFNVKMTFVVATVVALVFHMIKGESRALMGITFILTLATVYAGIDLVF